MCTGAPCFRLPRRKIIRFALLLVLVLLFAALTWLPRGPPVSSTTIYPGRGDAARRGILTVSDPAHARQYALNLQSILCLSALHGYTVISSTIDHELISVCALKQGSSFFALKMCTVYAILVVHPEIEWLVVLDGDVAVINPIDHKIEDYLGNRVQDLVLSMRFHNNEFASGHYIVRNSAWGRAFMREWYELLMPGSVYNGMNMDNGALHWMLLHRLTTDEERDQRCVSLAKSHNVLQGNARPESYPSFVACVHRNLAATGCRSALWHHVLVLPHTKGFAVDQWLTERRWADRTFMLHDVKEQRPEFVRCPPYPTRSEGTSNYTSDRALEQLMEAAAVDALPLRLRHGYSPDSCVFRQPQP